MIAKLPGARSDGRGRSFKALIDYILHDKNRARTARRVAWAEPVNCGLGGNLRRAWYEMMLTWENRAALKRAAGIPLTGRDNERPVLHLTLSWHPGERPDRREMMDAALSALDWLDLGEHQAIVAAHNDEPHPHVHIAVNTVHPVTGLTANLYQSKKALSAWALNWEENHGGIIVAARAANRPGAFHRSQVATGPSQASAEPMPEHDHPAVHAANDNSASIAAPAPALRTRFRAAVLAFAILTPWLSALARLASFRPAQPQAPHRPRSTQAPIEGHRSRSPSPPLRALPVRLPPP